jgi:hypothetical protein
MATRRPFPPRVLREIEASRYLWIRAGTRHRFIGIWLVVVDGRVFVRSWTLKPEGWQRTFQKHPYGAIRLSGRVVRIRAARTRSERLLREVDRAYREKYTTPGSIRYVRGLSRGPRRASTMELVPR